MSNKRPINPNQDKEGCAGRIRVKRNDDEQAAQRALSVSRTTEATALAAAAAVSDHANSLMCLPEAVLLSMLEYVSDDMFEMMRLAMVSKTMSETVYKSSWVWSNLDWGKPPLFRYARRLKDSDLRALLERTRETTRSICLRGCTAIRGSGLEPLRGSRQVEKMDLMIFPPHFHRQRNHLNHELIVNILSSMIPQPSSTDISPKDERRLLVVKFNEEHRLSPDVQPFLRNLHEAWKHRIEGGSVECDICRGDVSRMISIEENGSTRAFCRTWCIDCGSMNCRTESCPQLGTGLGTISNHEGAIICGGCTALHTCKSCPTDVRLTQPCSECISRFCVSCNDGNYCEGCNQSFCNSCRNSDVCDTCGLSFCEECRRMCECAGTCSRAYCEECNDSLRYCDNCGESFCEDCRACRYCFRCCETFCEDCRDCRYCYYCDETFCEDCRDCRFCNGCCHFVCDECYSVRYCSNCSESFCEECRDFRFCNKCWGSICEACDKNGDCCT